MALDPGLWVPLAFLSLTLPLVVTLHHVARRRIEFTWCLEAADAWVILFGLMVILFLVIAPGGGTRFWGP